MKKFFIIFCIVCFGLPSFAYIDDFIAEKYLIWNSKKTSLFVPFINGTADKITGTYCNDEDECFNITFYKIDNTFASSQRGSIVNYRKGEFQDTRPVNLP